MMNVLKLFVRFCVTAAVMVASSGSGARAQEGPFKPTDEHKMLASEEGTWDATVKTFTGGPDAEPMVSKGSETNTLMPGGLWMLSKFEGDFGGMKFEGRGQFGYDPLKKKYIGTWIDSMSPGLTVLDGDYDAKAKTMTYTGEGVEPASKMKYKQKMVTVTRDDGSRVFTLYMTMDATGGKETKFMEITYTRRK
jgi:hypothetical protein